MPVELIEYALSMLAIPLSMHLHIYLLIVLSSVYKKHYSCYFFGITTFWPLLFAFLPLSITFNCFAYIAYTSEVGDRLIFFVFFCVACIFYHISNKMSNEVIPIIVTKHVVFMRIINLPKNVNEKTL